MAVLWDAALCALIKVVWTFQNTLMVKEIGFGPGSVVGLMAVNALDGPGIEYRWERDFTHLSRPTVGPTHPPVQWVSGLSRE